MTIETFHHRWRQSLASGAFQLISERRIAYASIMLALCLGLATFAVLSSEAFLQGRSNIALILFGFDSLVLLVLLLFVSRRIISLVKDRKRRRAGYQLHWRLVVLFSAITVLPAVIVMSFSVFVLDYSLRGWFSTQISTAIDESVTIANSYLEEHKRSVTGQILAIANDINREASNLTRNRNSFDAFLTNQAGARDLSEALVVDSTGRVLARSDFAYSITFSNLEDGFFEMMRGGEVAIAGNDGGNRIRAGIRLNRLVDAYLLVGKFVDSAVLEAVDRTRFAASAYQFLDIRQLDLQINFSVLFGMVALLLLLGSVWVGLSFANAIVSPISSIIGVADKVRSGDLNSRVGVLADKGEIAELGASFDRMLDDINKNRQQLVEANRQLDKRREFTEAVLAGVASGVIGTDEKQVINLPNVAACEILGLDAQKVIGYELVEVLPEFVPLLEGAEASGARKHERNIEINREGISLSLRARITTEKEAGRTVGYVVTFENVSDLLDAQRKAAWADVARRIAHEIKNPLTPIQLAAERLTSKYTPADPSEKRGFETYIDTIIRQVDDIGRLVDEFSTFARMPAPMLKNHNLLGIIESQIALFKIAHKDIIFTTHYPESQRVNVVCDDGMIRQVITNLVQNAVDAMIESETADKKMLVSVTVEDELVTVALIDNGPGLPIEGRRDLTEPYVTHREKGTGLGLAIVGKISEDHKARLILANNGEKQAVMHENGYNGASIALVFKTAPDNREKNEDET